MTAPLMSNQVKQGEQNDPHDIYEVPVKAKRFEGEKVFLGDGPFPDCQLEQGSPNHPDEDVGAVDAGKGKKRRAKGGIEPDPTGVQGNPFGCLAADEY